MALAAVLVSLGFSACSGDDDEEPLPTDYKVRTSTVFKNGLLKNVSGSELTYNSDGTLAQVAAGGVNAVFGYYTSQPKDDIITFEAHMSLVGNDGWTYGNYDLALYSSGFVMHCHQTGSQSGNIETWDFNYNSEGRMNYFKRSKGGNVEARISYRGGDAVKTEFTAETTYWWKNWETTTTYTDIENTCGVMLFNETLGLSLDEMQYAYYAGMLGKSTRHLPASCTVTKDDETTTKTFKWTLDEKNRPVEMVATSDDGSSDTYTFEWE